MATPAEAFPDSADQSAEMWFDPDFHNDFGLVPVEFGGHKGLVHETNSLPLIINAHKSIKEGRLPANDFEWAYMLKLSNDPIMRLAIETVYDRKSQSVEAVESILTLDARHSSQFMYLPSGDVASSPEFDAEAVIQEDGIRKYYMAQLYEEFASVARSFDPYYNLNNFVA